MTRELAENFIRWSMAGNSEDRFRPNEHLHLVLRLMYYSHIKTVYIRRLTPSDIEKSPDGGGYANYTTERGGEYLYSARIEKEEMDLLEAYIKKHNVKQDKPIIQVGERALTKIFDRVAEVYKVSGEPKARLVDIYFAGIGKES